MGALALHGRGDRPEDFGIVLDLGPQKPVHFPEGVYSLRATSSSSSGEHFLRHRQSELWSDPKAETVTELYAFDASFVLVPGLLGYGSSFRSTNFPLEFVRQQDSKLFIGEYDGSNALRADATFELRSAADDGAESAKAVEDDAGEGIAANDVVCIMLASCPGKYLRVDKDNRAVLDKFDILNQAAHHFRLVAGLALEWASDLGEPVVFEQAAVDVSKFAGDDSRQESNVPGYRQVQQQSPEPEVELGGRESTLWASPPPACPIPAPEATIPIPEAAAPAPAFSLPWCDDSNSAFWAMPGLRQEAVAASAHGAKCSTTDSAGWRGKELNNRLPVLEFEVVD